MRKNTLVFTLLAMVLSGAPQANTDDGSASAAGAPPSAMHTGLAVTGGCVGGAILGTVVPIFGNFVGCAVGGLVAWWVRRPAVAEDTGLRMEETRQPVDTGSP